MVRARGYARHEHLRCGRGEDEHLVRRGVVLGGALFCGVASAAEIRVGANQALEAGASEGGAARVAAAVAPNLLCGGSGWGE